AFCMFSCAYDLQQRAANKKSEINLTVFIGSLLSIKKIVLRVHRMLNYLFGPIFFCTIRICPKKELDGNKVVSDGGVILPKISILAFELPAILWVKIGSVHCLI